MNGRSHEASLLARFPALARLGSRRERIPFVPQMTSADCGQACLAMTLAAHGRWVSNEELHGACGGLSTLGLDAASILKAAALFGLRGRGVKVEDPDDLRLLDPGSILHWQFRHFVVLERTDSRGAWVLDPAYGRRRVSFAELDRSFTGVALLFTPGEGFAPGGERGSILRRLLAKVREERGLLTRVVTLSLFVQVLALALPILTGVVVDRVVPRGEAGLLPVLLGGALVLMIFQFLSSLVRAHLVLALRTRLDARLTLDFLEHLVRLPYLFFQQRASGDLLMRLNSNATIREILTSAVLSGVLDGAFVGFYLVLLLMANVELGLAVLALAALRVGIFLAARNRQRLLMTEALEAQSQSQSYQVQLLAGIESLKASGAEDRAVEHFSRLFVRELNVSLSRGRLDAAVNATLEALGYASPVLLLLLGAQQVLAGELTLGTMLSALALAGGFLAPLTALIANAGRLQLLGSYLERLDDVLRAPAEPFGPQLTRPALAGGVRAEGLVFRYGPLVPPALDGVSFEIQPGQLIAVVGSSGSGKSTLASLLAGLLVPDAGFLRYDEHGQAEIEPRWLRGQIGYVSQRPYLFGASLRNNIALAEPSLALAEIVEAAKLAEIHDEILALPMGYETVLSDGGSTLSGGQRQRVALARALAARPRILILDEATSALDTVTESRIQRNLAALAATRIVVAHRLSTVREADQILVLDRGHVAERGTHDELLRLGGRYAELVAAQMGPSMPPAISPFPVHPERGPHRGSNGSSRLGARGDETRETPTIPDSISTRQGETP